MSHTMKFGVEAQSGAAEGSARVWSTLRVYRIFKRQDSVICFTTFFPHQYRLMSFLPQGEVVWFGQSGPFVL